MDPTAKAVLLSVAVVLFVAAMVQDLRPRPAPVARVGAGLAVVAFVWAWDAWVAT